MKYVFAKSFLPVALLASFSSQAQLTLELDADLPLNVHEARYNAALGILEVDSVLAQTESFIACYNANGERADIDPATAAGLVASVDGHAYELFGSVVYNIATGPALQTTSANGELTCALTGETDLQLAFDGDAYGGPVSLRRAIQFTGANPSPFITNDVVICNGAERTTPRAGLDLDLQPWFPGLASLLDTVDGPDTQDWVDAGFGSLGDVFGANTVRFGGGNVLTVETHDGFSCRTFPASDTSSFSAGLADDDWFQSCVNPDGIFCDAFQRDESLDGLAVVIERTDVSSRGAIETAAPGDVVEVQLRAINLGLDAVDGRLRWYPMMAVCEEGEACPEVAAVGGANYDITISALPGTVGADEFVSDTVQFTVPQTALPGERYRIVAASFVEGEVDPRPELTRAQLVIEVQ